VQDDMTMTEQHAVKKFIIYLVQCDESILP